MPAGEYLQVFFFGVVQGVSEFLPISSTGHLVLLKSLLNTNSLDLLFVLVLHAGTLMAILSYYKKELYEVLKNFISRPFSLNGAGGWVYLTGIACVPGVAGAILLKPHLQKTLEDPRWTGLGFILTAFFLFFTRRFQDTSLFQNIRGSFWRAFVIGIAQTLAFFPGMSRAGWTISTGLFLGLSQKQAVFFSFLMAIPAITGGLLWELISAGFFSSPPVGQGAGAGAGAGRQIIQSPGTFLSLTTAFFVSWFCGLLALKALIKSLKTRLFPFFAFYLWPLGIFTLLFI